MPVGEMTRRMSALEETYWVAKYSEAPLPTEQIVAHLAQIAMWIQHVNVKQKDRGKLTDFMLYFKKKIVVQKNVGQDVRSFFGKLKKEE